MNRAERKGKGSSPREPVRASKPVSRIRARRRDAIRSFPEVESTPRFGYQIRPKSFPAEKLRILLLEDSANDTELVRLELERVGINHSLQSVSTKSQFVAALHDFKPDLVLTDYKLPDISGNEAISLV